MNEFEALFKGIPIPSYAWKKKENDFILIDYNLAAEKITKGQIKNYLGNKASEMYKDQPKILEEIHRCFKDQVSIFREMKYNYMSTGEEKYLSVKYGFVPPDLVLVHTEDITKKKRVEQLVKRRLEVERVISAISSRLINPINFNEAINASLGDIGRLCRARYSYLLIFREKNEIINITHEWCAEGMESQIEKFQAFSFDKAQRWIDKIKRGKFIHIINVLKMPAEASLQKELFENQDLKSFLALPLTIGNKISGFIGVENLKETGGWNEEDFKLLQITSEIIGNAIKREQAEKKIKESEKELWENKERFRSLVETTSDWIWEVDNVGIYTYVSPKIWDLLGYKTEEVIGKTPFDLMPPDEAERVRKIFQSIIISQKSFMALENTNLHKNGRLITLETSGVPIFDENEIFLGYRGIDRDITRRKKVEEELKKLNRELEQKVEERTVELKNSEKKYRSIVENTNDVIMVTRPNGLISYLSPACINVLGYEPNELVGKHPWIIHQDDLEKVKKIHDNAIKGKSGSNFEYRIKTKKNLIKWVSHSWSPILKENDVQLIVSIIRDITKHKEVEEKLKESEEKYRLITETANDLISVFNDRFKYEYINEEVHEKLLGYSKEDLIGKSGLELLHRNDYKNGIKALNMGNKIGESIGEVRLKNKDGDYSWFEIKGIKFKNTKGETKALLISRNINDRKRTEQKLKESEEKYRFLFEKSPNSIALLNKKGLFLDCNSETEKIFGFKKNELIGKDFTTVGAFTLEQVSEIKGMYNKALKGEIIEPVEHQIKRKDGSSVWIYYHISLINIDNEILIEVIGQDISVRKKAEKMIKKEIEKLKEIDQIRTDLISRTSHELKTPLVSICSSTELLLNHYTEHFDDTAKGLIEIINRGGERLKKLINDLFDVSKVESSKLKLKKQKENITKIIKECVNDMFYLAKKRKLVINLDISKDYYIEVDKVRIEQVITNLLINALKNTPPKGNIFIYLQKEDDFIDIKIKDTGVGFTLNEKEKIFKKFGKIERYGKGMDIDTEGTGLGLYISKALVLLHGGEIWVESKGRNKGAIFIIRLPIN
ncbi:MAG: sensor histidine kinase [Promethearchaeota archaeon]